MANLEIVEVFEYYDGPQLFSCRSSSGCLYLVVGVEADETTETWLYAPVSVERLIYVRSGGMDLRTAFSTPEDGYLLVIKTHRDGKANLSALVPADLNKAWLPVGGERLSLSAETLLPLKREDLQIKATQRWREHVALVVQPPKSRRNEAPAALAGEVLVQAQGMIASIEEEVARSHSPRRRLPKEWVPEATFNLTAMAGGSCVLELTAEKSGDPLFGTSIVGDAVEQFVKLINAGANEQTLKEQLASLEARTASRYRKLLLNLAAGETGLSVEWASPTENRGGKASLTAKEVVEVYDLVNQMGTETEPVREIFGTLRGFMPSSKLYEFFDPGESRRYRGKVDDSVLPVISVARLGSSYFAKLQALVEVHAVTGQERTQWQMVDLRKPEGSREEPD